MRSFAWRMWRGASVASTASVMGGCEARAMGSCEARAGEAPNRETIVIAIATATVPTIRTRRVRDFIDASPGSSRSGGTKVPTTFLRHELRVHRNLRVEKFRDRAACLRLVRRLFEGGAIHAGNLGRHVEVGRRHGK